MQLVPFLPLAAPILLAGAAIRIHTAPADRARSLSLARLASLASLGIAAAAVALLLTTGADTSPLVGVAGIGVSARLDALSVTLFSLVAFVGAIVVQFSRNYLDGDANQPRFMADLCLTLAAVTLLVLAGNLAHLAVAWVATSLCLHRLLLFYPQRRGAVIAARKKFIAARLSDVCLVVACVLLAREFHTTDIAAISALARAGGDWQPGLAAVLVAIAALLKSAQFPAHGWLTEVMETPTPVSALLHAGIINAGGFLVIRLADVLLLTPGSMHLLAIVGGFTALFGGLVMLTQSSVKVSLAWSTVAQMGFMLLQCGLGAFSIAVLHIVAHSLYKAHAFLSSGSVVDIARASWVPDADIGTHPGRIGAALGMALVLCIGLGLLTGIGPGADPAGIVLGSVLVMSLTLLLAPAMSGRADSWVLGRTAGLAAIVAIAWFVLHAAAQAWLEPALPATPTATAGNLVIVALVIASLAAVTLLQLLAPARLAAPFWRRAWVHMRNGLYVNALFNRSIGALRLNPEKLS